VQFVDFSTEQKPLLVMEYLPLGSLACQRGITEEETLGILCQGLQALEYLHSQRLAHRDIKPENILLQSRTPFLIKLGDFGLAKNDSILETFCGSNAYAAPEIWEGRSYTTAVDIWSLGVIVLQYAYCLPKPTQKRKGSQWCRDIVKAANDGEDSDTLIDLISTKMLTMNYQDRLSASDCLEQAYLLGFHNVHTFETGYATPTGKSTRQHDITRRTGSRSIVMQPLQKISPDGDVSSGFYYVGGSSESTEIAPSKRDLREAIQHYNRASQRSLQHAQGATQIWNPQPEDIPKSRLSKRQRQQTVQSPSDDARGRGQSKRSRASVSFEAGEDPSKPSSPRNSAQGPKQIERSLSTHRKGHDPAAQPPRQIPQLDPGKEPSAEDVASFTQAVEPIPRVSRTTRQVARKSTQNRTRSAEVSLGEVETLSSKRNIHDNVRAMLAGNLDGGNEGKAKVHHPQ